MGDGKVYGEKVIEFLSSACILANTYGNAYGGIIMAQSDIKESSERFKIFNTGQDIAE